MKEAHLMAQQNKQDDQRKLLLTDLKTYFDPDDASGLLRGRTSGGTLRSIEIYTESLLRMLEREEEKSEGCD